MAERRIMTVVGARPQFVKAAMLSRALAAAGLPELLVHTGQHYDEAMSGAFFRDLALPEPVRNLAVGSASHGVQTARMMEGLERTMQELRPDTVVVFGDTNSTLAGALAAAKLGIHLAHVEAGMRCGDRRMPEEINRVLTDRLADLLLCTSAAAATNLQREGARQGIHVVGDLMVDACLAFAPADPTPWLEAYSVQPKQFIYATLHRAENTDDAVRLRRWIVALAAAGRGMPVLLCAHPRTAAAIMTHGIPTDGVRMHGPASYRTSLALCRAAHVVATDSGGLQKEAAVLGTPVVVLRERSEWTELVDSSHCILVPDPSGLAAAIAAARSPQAPMPGDRDAAAAITRLLADV